MHAIIPERYGRGVVRALVVSNMLPDTAHPERGSFVRDQVAALRRIDGIQVELYEFAPGGARSSAPPPSCAGDSPRRTPWKDASTSSTPTSD